MAKAEIYGYGPTLYPPTVSPTGVTMTRSGETFTLTWKKGDENYGDGQRIVWFVGTEKIQTYNFYTRKPMDGWKYIAQPTIYLGGDVTSKNLSVSLATYPKLFEISVQLYALRKEYSRVYEETDEAIYYQSVRPTDSYTTYVWAIKPPNKATSVSCSLSTYNRCRYAWTFEPDDTAHEWYTGYEWDSVLVANSTITDGSKINYNNTSGSAYRSGRGTAPSGEVYIEEDTTAQGFKTSVTYTRWFRIRAVGPAGASGYSYTKHVYARPNSATLETVKATIINNNSTLVWTKWTLNVTANRPVDEVKVQYLIAVPGNGLSAPANGWNDAPGGTITDTDGTDGLTFIVPEIPGTDRCLWTRVMARHDEADISYSSAMRAMVGRLATPSNLSVTVDQTTHKANITATNNSAVPDSFLVVTYTDNKNYSKGAIIAKIDHGQTTVNNVQCPDWGTGSPSFSVYAVQGSYTAGGNFNARVVQNMTSPVLRDGGNVPIAPTVTLKLTDIPNTVNANWTWNWAGATFAEISWADHEDAWMSTSSPSTYTVNSIQSPSWNISNLDPTKTWYVRMRFGTGGGENTLYGPYSSTKSINISKEENLAKVFKPTLYYITL